MNLIVRDPVCRGEAEAALEHFYEQGRLSLFNKQDRMAKGALQRLQGALGQYQDQMDQALGTGQAEPDVWAPYREALQSSDEAVRLQAVAELGRSGEEPAGRILMDLLSRQDDLGGAAAFHLGRSGLEPLFSRLPAGLRGQPAAVRKNTALAMGFTGRNSFSDVLLASASSEANAEVRQAMIAAVGEIGNPEAVPSLKNLARTFPVHGDQVAEILHRLEEAE
jgi:HEAT repeat protein